MRSVQTLHKRKTNHEQISAKLHPFTYVGCVPSFATWLSERGVHRAGGGGVSHVGQHVAVDVEGKADVRVAE